MKHCIVFGCQPNLSHPHLYHITRFVLLSAHGAHVVTQLRPADHLRRLLVDHGGPDNDVVRAFFALHSEVQAAATALVLATSRAPQDAQVVRLGGQSSLRAILIHVSSSSGV